MDHRIDNEEEGDIDSILDLEKQDNQIIPFITVEDFNNRIITIYLDKEHFSCLWFIPFNQESGFVGYKNYQTWQARNNFYEKIGQAKRTYRKCQEALAMIDVKFVWEGKANYVQNS